MPPCLESTHGLVKEIVIVRKHMSMETRSLDGENLKNFLKYFYFKTEGRSKKFWEKTFKSRREQLDDIVSKSEGDLIMQGLNRLVTRSFNFRLWFPQSIKKKDYYIRKGIVHKLLNEVPVINRLDLRNMCLNVILGNFPTGKLFRAVGIAKHAGMFASIEQVRIGVLVQLLVDNRRLVYQLEVVYNDIKLSVEILCIQCSEFQRRFNLACQDEPLTNLLRIINCCLYPLFSYRQPNRVLRKLSKETRKQFVKCMKRR